MGVAHRLFTGCVQPFLARGVSMRRLLVLFFVTLLLGCASTAPTAPRATGDLALIIERASGHVTLASTTSRQPYARIGGLGDLSHASAVY